MDTKRKKLSAEATQNLKEGISLIFSLWTALQLAIDHEAGDPHSRLIADNFINKILSWFTQSKEPLDNFDLEHLLDNFFWNSPCTEVQDESIQQLARDLIRLHDECLENNFAPIERLRQKDRVHMNSHVKLAQSIENDDEEESDDESMEGDGSSNMMVDAVNPKSSCPSAQQSNMLVDKPSPKEVAGDKDGWNKLDYRFFVEEESE